jgi:cytochrome c-type biogenesis protein CcmF
MTWRHCGALKKTALSLAVITYCMCHFATFLTRSGVFSSVHAFSQSPIGWMFLGFMSIAGIGGGTLIFVRRGSLEADRPIASIWSREAVVLTSTVLLVLFALATTAGTVLVPVSKLIFGRQITVGPAFYNNVLIPIGLMLLGQMALAPALQWGRPPTASSRFILGVSCGLAIAAAILGLVFGLKNPIAIAVTALGTLVLSILIGCFLLDLRRRAGMTQWQSLLRTIQAGRRQYAGFLIHVGFLSVAIGVTGSSLGTSRHELLVDEGQSIEWAGVSIRYERLVQRELKDKLVAEAVLQITPASGGTVTLKPARHLHLLQNEWTSEVAIYSTWSGDLYTILNSGEGNGRVSLTLVHNPLMRFLWLGGCVMVVASVISLWPARARSGSAIRLKHTPAIRRRRRELILTR